MLINNKLKFLFPLQQMLQQIEVIVAYRWVTSRLLCVHQQFYRLIFCIDQLAM